MLVEATQIQVYRRQSTGGTSLLTGSPARVVVTYLPSREVSLSQGQSTIKVSFNSSKMLFKDMALTFNKQLPWKIRLHTAGTGELTD